jgi:hypothetical protein
MDNEQTNRVTMFKTVISYMDDNSSVWNTMSPLQAAMTLFKEKGNNIDAAARKQETPTGATQDKATARDTLEVVLFLTCEALGTLAHELGNNDLVALTDVTRTSLDRMDEEELSNRAAAVRTAAGAQATELATFQVTQANLDELSQALENFNAAKTGPRNATAARAAQTESLPNLIREASTFLRNRIDRMVNLFSRSNPDFVSGYRSARVIVDRPATHASAKPAPSPPPPHP